MDPINFNDRSGSIKTFMQNIFSKKEGEETVPKNSVRKNIICILLTVILAAVLYYFMLPVMNFKEIKMYFYLGIVLAAYPVFLHIVSGALLDEGKKNYAKRRTKPFVILIFVLILTVVGGLFSSAIFFSANGRFCK